jgi:predicted DsbA family dithiol-disulfide isomerase
VEGLAPVRKSGPYDVSIVYFMDYQCPSCRQYTPDVARVLKEDRRVRVIYRDTPLLGPKSEEAARAAIASHFQGRHEAFHHALMTTKGSLDETAIRAAAQKAGVDWSRLQRDLQSRADEIDEVITRNLELAAATGIQGTPAFIVGESQSNGALDYKLLKAEIADARKAMIGSEQLSDRKVEDRTNPILPETEKSPEERQINGVPTPSISPLFRPAQSDGQELATDSDEGTDDAGLSPWLVAALLALFASGGAWMWASGRRESRSARPKDA